MEVIFEVPETFTFRRHGAECIFDISALPPKALHDVFVVGLQRHFDVASAPVNDYVESEKEEGRELTLAEAVAELAEKRYKALLSGDYGTRQGGPRKDPLETEILHRVFLWLRARKVKAEKAREATKNMAAAQGTILAAALALEAAKAGVAVDKLSTEGQKLASARMEAIFTNWRTEAEETLTATTISL